MSVFFTVLSATVLLTSCNKEDFAEKDEKEANYACPCAREFYHYMEGVKYCTEVKVRLGGGAPDGIDGEGFVWCPFDCNSNSGGDYVYIGMKFEPWNASNKSNYINNIIIYIYAVKDKGSSEDSEEYNKIKSGNWSKVIDGCTYYIESNRNSLNSGIQHIERRYNLFVAYTRDNYKDENLKLWGPPIQYIKGLGPHLKKKGGLEPPFCGR